jgi:hypothetical protein
LYPIYSSDFPAQTEDWATATLRRVIRRLRRESGSVPGAGLAFPKEAVVAEVDAFLGRVGTAAAAAGAGAGDADPPPSPLCLLPPF